MVEEDVVLALFRQARDLAPVEFGARYDQLKVEPVMVWERDDTFFVVLRGESREERWVECVRVIPFADGNGVGHFVKVDRMVEL